MLQKDYRTTVRSDDDNVDLPVEARFGIELATAQEILRLAALVAANGLFKVEKFDYRASWLEGPDPDAFVEASSDSDTLNVSATEFWFSAYLKHTKTEVVSERQKIDELATFFGMDAVAESKVEAAKFVNQVANLKIWGWCTNGGELYQECPDPSEGESDSHSCLMGLIEEARKLLAASGSDGGALRYVAVTGDIPGDDKTAGSGVLGMSAKINPGQLVEIVSTLLLGKRNVSFEDHLKRVESVLYLALLHSDLRSLGALLQDVKNALEEPLEPSGELESAEAYQNFIYSIAKTVSESCGGTIVGVPPVHVGKYWVEVKANECLPEDGGIWKDFGLAGLSVGAATDEVVSCDHG